MSVQLKNNYQLIWRSKSRCVCMRVMLRTLLIDDSHIFLYYYLSGQYFITGYYEASQLSVPARCEHQSHLTSALKPSLWYWQVLCYWGPFWAISSPCNFWGWCVATNTGDLILPNYSYLPFWFSLSATMLDTAFLKNIKCSLFLTGKSYPHCEILEKLCVWLSCFILWNNYPPPDQIW